MPAYERTKSMWKLLSPTAKKWKVRPLQEEGQ